MLAFAKPTLPSLSVGETANKQSQILEQLSYNQPINISCMKVDRPIKRRGKKVVINLAKKNSTGYKWC